MRIESYEPPFCAEANSAVGCLAAGGSEAAVAFAGSHSVTFIKQLRLKNWNEPGSWLGQLWQMNAFYAAIAAEPEFVSRADEVVNRPQSRKGVSGPIARLIAKNSIIASGDPEDVAVVWQNASNGRVRNTGDLYFGKLPVFIANEALLSSNPYPALWIFCKVPDVIVQRRKAMVLFPACGIDIPEINTRSFGADPKIGMAVFEQSSGLVLRKASFCALVSNACFIDDSETRAAGSDPKIAISGQCQATNVVSAQAHVDLFVDFILSVVIDPAARAPKVQSSGSVWN